MISPSQSKTSVKLTRILKALTSLKNYLLVSVDHVQNVFMYFGLDSYKCHDLKF
jgi:hypothetical protein